MKHKSGAAPLLWILLILLVGGCLVVYDPEFITHIIIAAGILLFAVMLFVILYSGFWLARNKLSRVVRVRARVVRRRKKDWEVGLIGGQTELERLSMMGSQSDDAWKAYSHRMAKGDDVREVNLAAGTNFFVTFDVNGQEKEFSVPEDYYVKCNEGTEGLLVYRGEEFMQFIPDVADRQ